MEQNKILEVQSLSLPIFATFGLYALVMIFIGFYFYRRTNSPEQFFLGGRNMGPTVSALSAGASDMSSWLLMGLPGALYVAGLLNAWIAIGLSAGMLTNWLLVAKRLRIFTEVVSNSLTIPDYFETRFNDTRHILRLISAVVILIFFVFYISSGLIAGAKLFEQTFHIDYSLALIIGAGIIVIYTFFGGYLAVCWTDLLQGLLMMAALIIVPCVLLYELGGWEEAVGQISSYDATTNAASGQALNHFSFFTGLGWVEIISAVAWGLGYFGQPHIIVRFMSIRSVRELPRATVVGMGWMVISLAGACLVGLLGLAFVTKNNLTLKDPETIFIVMSQILFNPWITGLLLSALLAAIMSTASSQLLVSASTVAEDFYKKILRTEATPRQVMFFSRASVLVVSLVAFVISVDQNSTILSIVAYAWAGFGASFGAVILYSLFWRGMSRAGAISGMIAGAVVVVIHKNFTYQFFPIYEIVPGFLAATLLIFVVSLFAPASQGEREAFEKMESELVKF